ncbi:MAG: PIN domain-containing protein [Candidatus Aminicenantes bacterium]|nr:MAG: PIN domain-containing protein [Candidatus Aminicenantes bacterium]
MSVFLDTNVIVYAFDGAEPAKQRVAIEILEAGDRLVVSTQVLLETWWVLTRKLETPLDDDSASKVIEELSALPVVATDPELVRRAIDTGRRFHLAVWNALIIEAARTAGCRRVLSEDLNSGQDFDGVMVENPFTD